MGISAAPKRLDAFFADPKVPEADKRAVAGQLRSSKPAVPPIAEQGGYPQPGDDVSVTGALKESGRAIGSAVKSVFGPAVEAAGRLSPHIPQPPKTLGQEASDVATLAGTALAPEIAAAQVGVGAARRAAGGTEAEGQQAETLTGVAGLGAGIASAGRQGVRAATARPTVVATEAGATLQSKLPGAATALRQRVQSEFYEPVAKYAQEKGLALTPGSPQAAKIADALDAAHAKWGPTPPGEKLLGKLRGEGVEGPPAPITYADLDEAKRLLPGRAKEARGAIDTAIDDLVAGTPAGAKLRAGKAEWKLNVIPAKRLAARVENAEGPLDALNVLTAANKGPHRRELAARVLGGDANQWDDALDALASLRKAKPSTLERFGQYAQNRALYQSAIGAMTGAGASGDPLWGGIGGALAGLALGGAVSHAGTAARFLYQGAQSRPAAVALSNAIESWADGQEDEAVKGAARDVAAALRGDTTSQPTGTPVGTSRPTVASAPRTAGSAPLATGVSPKGVQLPYSREVDVVSRVVGIDPSLIHSVIRLESGGKRSAVSEAGAVGLMQLLPDTFERLRPRVEAVLGRPADIHNPWDNITAGALLYKEHLDEGHGVEHAARLYHGGTNRGNWGPKTFGYATNVSNLYDRMRGEVQGGQDEY